MSKKKTNTKYQLYINGKWREAADGSRFDADNPYTGEAWASFAEATTEDVESAIDAARHAFDTSWWRHEPRQRAAALQKLSDLLSQNAELMGRIEATDNGKLIGEMTAMAGMVPTYYRYFGEAADHIFGHTIRGASKDVFSYTLREPYGVVAVQTPWNTPLVIMSQAVAPALAAGNCVVIKPSEFASASTVEFAKLVDEAGFPPGVVNVVTGMGPVVGAALCSNPKVNKIAFTGSPTAGRLVARQASDLLIPTILELGGKSANIVFADADIDKAATGVVGGFTAASGQSCICGSRALVQRTVYDEVLDKIVAAVKSLTIGDPFDPKTQVGPFCTAQQLEKVEHFVKIGKDEGARLVAGGNKPDLGQGWFFEPTVFADVDPNMEIAQEEIFGPVLSVIPFEDEAEAIAIANNSIYGLGSGVWTQSPARAHRVAAEIRAGTVWINQYRRGDAAFPFGGVKESGYGRQSGQDAIYEFTTIKSVQMNIEPGS